MPSDSAAQVATAAATSSAASATTAAQAAQKAVDTLGSVTATNDGIMAAVAADPGSEFAVVQSTTLASKWRASTAYVTGDVRQAPDGTTVRRNASGTSGASFSTTQLAAPVLDAPTTTTTGGTIAAGTTYFYRATALNALGETLGSTEVSKAIAAALATPTGVSIATATTGGSLAPGTFSYRVSATNALGETLASTAVTQTIPAALAAPVLNAPTTATTGGTLAAATYFYKITAINAIGETVGSNEVSQATTGTTSTVGLSWAAITGATGYKIYRATTTGGQSTSPALVAEVGAVTSYTDTGTAVSAGAVPATNTTSTTTNANTVTWAATTGATGYKVYGRTESGELLIATVGEVTTYTDTGSVTPAGALPTANTTATNTNTVGLSWGAVTGATGYKVYRATAAGGQSTSPALLATLGAVTTYTDTGAAVTAGGVPATNTTSESAFWTAIGAVPGTMEQVSLSDTLGTEIGTPATPARVAVDAAIDTRRVVLVFDGDSQFAGAHQKWGMTVHRQIARGLGPDVASYNVALGGQTLADMQTTATDVDSKYDPTRRNVLVVWGGTNDLAQPLTAAACIANLQTYVQARKAVGWEVVVGTVLPRSSEGTAADYETKRITFNQWVRDNAAAEGFTVADVGADTKIGDAGDETSTLYYQTDLVHVNNAGASVAASYFRTALGTIGMGVIFRPTESIWLGAQDFETFSTCALFQWAQHLTWAMDPDTNEPIRCSKKFPIEGSTLFNVDIFYGTSGTGGGTVVWNMTMYESGETLAYNPTATVNYSGADADLTGKANTVVRYRLSSAFYWDHTKVQSLLVQRSATHASDTHAADVYLLGVLITPVSAL